MSSLAILRSDALHIYTSDHATPVGGSFPKTAVSDMEVVNEGELSGFIAKLFPVAPHAPVPLIFVVSDELCFSLPFSEANKEEVEKRLVSLTPFSHVATTRLAAQKQEYFVATNQDLYESVARALMTVGYQTTVVIPWTHLLQLGFTKGEVDTSVVKRVFDGLTTIRPYGFPLTVENREEPVSSVPTMGKHPTKFHRGWIVFAVVALLYAFGMYWFFIRTG